MRWLREREGEKVRCLQTNWHHQRRELREEAKSKGIKIELSQANEMMEEEKSPTKKSFEVIFRQI